MKEITLVEELIWEYNYPRRKAEEIVSVYKKNNALEDLWELIKAKHKLDIVTR